MQWNFSDEPGRPSASPPGGKPPAPPPPEASDSTSRDGGSRMTMQAEAAMISPPFTPERMRRQIIFDSAMHWLGVLVMVAGLIVLLSLAEGGGTLLTVLPVILVLAGWMMINLISARVSRELPRLSALIGDDPTLAEIQLAEHLRRRPLLRWVRLMLYHHLAMLRHRQRRFAESAAICRAVLDYRLGPARDARPHLLLMMAESTLECRDLGSAYGALNDLHRVRLNLVEAIQRLALQTRYELMAGYDEAVLQSRQQKVNLAELMPAPQCAAMHAMLAIAADRRRDEGLASWLWRRVELLATPEQFERFRVGDFGVGIVDAVKPMAQQHGPTGHDHRASA
ncbi:hypothetical protein ACERK3_16710 [Phycisphaerales bacterium AB-hyl4]|uniref:Uncharacterized protein n=1 Tax=Natronomicrosphaera hydrolytica TaxID=3242702 RepID=A0ABV4U8I1_9BACT